MPENNNRKTKDMLQEEYAEQLLTAVYKNSNLDIYDYAAAAWPEEAFNETKSIANILVKEKLVNYTDEEHTKLSITNHGRYWMLKGGYVVFLRDSHNTKEHHPEKQHVKEELLEARLRLTHFRLIGFWLTLILSVTGFAFSIFNFYMLMRGSK